MADSLSPFMMKFVTIGAAIIKKAIKNKCGSTYKIARVITIKQKRDNIAFRDPFSK